MTRLLFDYENPLPLGLRRVIVARMICLIATSLDDDEATPSNWHEFTSWIDAKMTTFQAGAGQFDTDIVDFISDLTREFGKESSDSKIRDRIQAIRDLYEISYACQNCGQHKESCCGLQMQDWRHFQDNGDHDPAPAGTCMSFIRKLTRSALETSKQLYDGLGVSDLRPLPDEIVLALKASKGPLDATVPVNGKIRITDGKGELEVTWPSDSEDADRIQDGITMLAWLLFHEIFVHAFQGLAREHPIGVIKPQCAFTEGAVDAAACAQLGPRMLRGAQFPLELCPLRFVFDNATLKYNKTRQASTPQDRKPRREKSDSAKYRQARAGGRRFIWQPIADMQSSFPKATGNWAAEVMMRLNLDLDRNERDDFTHLMRMIIERDLDGNVLKTRLFDHLSDYRDGRTDRLILLRNMEVLAKFLR